MEDQTLKMYFKLDEADLAANHKGTFSHRLGRKLAIRQKKIVSPTGIPLSLIMPV
jgi:hypothetical protein